MFRLILILPMLFAACPKDETISGYVDRTRVFALTEMNGESFPARATIGFPQQGKIAGQGPCNAYSASQSAPLPWFQAGPIVSTERACPDLPQEAIFFATLSRMSLIETVGDVLILRNDSGEEMLFRAVQE